ncbi:MAG: glycosyltransferase family 39 protein [Bacteroidales bacterium]|nr:glycosyltransferase family 39 protein [Bacteroidales bacterium]
MATKKKIISEKEKFLNWKILLIIAVCFIAFIPSLKNDFVNWDDIVYIMNNDMITTFSWLNLQKMFSSFFMGNYHPLILLSFSFDFHLFQFDAHGYHVHNLVLHMINTFLVYMFFFNLMKKNINVSATIALLFAIHPMHVESVAWVSERKDLLYTAYFMLSLIAYLRYLNKGKSSFYFLSLLFFIFSLLSKAQAVTLPLVLFLSDYLLSRKFEWKNLLEKIPFLVLSLIFGITAVFAQKANGFLNPLDIPVYQSLFYAPYGVCIYLFKFVLPVYQTAVYIYPTTLAGEVPFYIYFSPIILIFVAIAIWKTWKNTRYITFGLLFFLTTILPVLQFLPVGPAVVSERYTYIPYLGLAAIVAILFWEKIPAMEVRWRNIFKAGASLLILILIILTWNRNLVWRDSVTLWTDVMEKNPRCISAYINRAFIFNEQKQYDEALQDCTDGLKIDSTNFTLYKNRGIAYGIIGKHGLALSDYSSAIKYNPNDYDSYLYRGILLTDKFAKHDSAISDFKKYLSHSPDNLNATFNLIVANYNKGSFDSARVYCLKVIALDPGNAQARQLLETIDKLKP